MARYLLDTTALIDFSKNHEPAVSIVLDMIEGSDEPGVCAVNIAEFYSGVPLEQHASWDRFFRDLHYREITRDVAARAGAWRYSFARQGRAIATVDALIAATAWEWGAVIVTSNVKDFPMSEVQLWSIRE